MNWFGRLMGKTEKPLEIDKYAFFGKPDESSTVKKEDECPRCGPFLACSSCVFLSRLDRAIEANDRELTNLKKEAK